jgi:nucleoside-diphosphate-sugar epimerase
LKIKAIITGSTGMVGKGVLYECLESSEVESVLVINRRPLGLKHEKLKEIIHEDFFNVSPIKEELQGYNACYFCLGISSVGLSEEKYHHFTYDLTTHFASAVIELNPEMTFIYVSGTGTDSTEKGKMMWGRVKGKTENALMAMPFKALSEIRHQYK